MHDLVVFSAQRWGHAPPGPQQLLSQLARDRRVFFVEKPEYTWGAAAMRVTTPTPGITVLRARTPVTELGFCDAQLAVLAPLLQQSLTDQGVREAVAWFHTPLALPLLGAVPALGFTDPPA
jgi:UDP-galactopyranose mutase